MSIRLASFSTLLALYFTLVAPTTLPAQDPGPNEFDITGFKLGIPGGPELKKEIESKPEGYICEDLLFEVGGEDKHLGYSCLAPKAKITPDMEWKWDVDYHLVTLFDQDSSKVWFIARMENLKENARPTKETMEEALIKKYGPPVENFIELSWTFDRNDQKNKKRCTGCGPDPCNITNINNTFSNKNFIGYIGLPPTRFYENCGITLNAHLREKGRENQVERFILTLIDSREQYARLAAEAQVEKEKQAEIERQKKAIPAPSF